MGIGHTCGYLKIEGVRHSFVPSCVTADAYILIRVHLFSCSVCYEPVFDQRFHSLLTCRKMSLISALIVLMKSCRFWCWKTEPKQQVEQEQDVDRFNE